MASMTPPWGPGTFAAVAGAALAAAAGCGAGAGMLAGTGGAGMTTGVAGTTGAERECSNQPRAVSKVIPDVMIVLDTSASMNDAIDGSCATACASKWAASVEGIDAVLSATAARINWGLTFIAGSAHGCDPTIGAPVGLDDSIPAALANRSAAGALAVSGNRPTGAAVEIAAAQFPMAGSSAERVILLLTDGVPGCVPGAVDPAAADTEDTVRGIGDARTSGVNTFVVGLATSGGPADTALGEMAVSGGLARADTRAYFPASSSAELGAAFDAFVSSTADCVFAVPPPVGTDGRESRDFIAVYLDDAAIIMDTANGWTYADAGHRAIRLHGPSCDAVTSQTPRKVGIVFVCTHGPP
jgi:hypothetical protein